MFLGRLTPGLRNLSVIAAGVCGVPYRVFLPPFAAASFLYILAFVLLGYLVGPAALQALPGPRLSLRLALTALVFLGLGALLVVLYRRAARGRHLAQAPVAPCLETAALAGFVATLLMATGVSLLLYLLAALGVGAAEQAYRGRGCRCRAS